MSVAVQTQFCIGDKVALRKDIKVGEVYGGVEFLPIMLFKGSREILPEFRIDDMYRLKGSGFIYTHEMLTSSKN